MAGPEKNAMVNRQGRPNKPSVKSTVKMGSRDKTLQKTKVVGSATLGKQVPGDFTKP